MKPIFQKTLFTIFLSLMAFPALGQEITGDYTMFSRRCEDTGKLVTPEDSSVMEMSFNQNGRFRHQFTYTNEPPERPTLAEIRDRHLRYFEEDKALHEQVCADHPEGTVIDLDTGQDLCTAEGKEKFYRSSRATRIRDAEREFEEREEEYDDMVSGHVFGDCVLTAQGSYSVQGTSLTLSISNFIATAACGSGASYPTGGAIGNIDYYFSNGKLYLVRPSDENSREYCGSSDWSEIYSRD